MMTTGLIALSVTALLAYLLRRHGDITRLQAHVLKARFVVENLLRQRRDMAEVWCSLCEERSLLPENTPSLRRVLLQLSRQAVAHSSEDGTGSFAADRLESERDMSRLLREGYGQFLHRMPDAGTPKDFFQQYFESLTHLEKDIGDSLELHNDSVQIFNRALSGWAGWFFRRLEKIKPRKILPSIDAADSRRLNWTEPEKARWAETGRTR